MKKEYEEPIFEIDYFNISSSVGTWDLSGGGWEEEGESPWSIGRTRDSAWGMVGIE